MEKTELHQLTLVFADSPQGSEPAKSSGVPDGKAWLLHQAGDKKMNALVARAAGADRLLERAASIGNLAQALRNVARNKGAAGVDGRSVAQVVAAAPSLLPKLRRELIEELKSIGFKYVSLDLEGFRSGSLNDALPPESLRIFDKDR